MKSISVHISELLEKLQQMSDRNVEYVRLSICDEAIDRNVYSPAFLHFEGMTAEAEVEDFESIDALNFCNNRSGQMKAV